MAITVKICGLSEPAGLHAALEGGADALGFIFFPPSPRYVDPARAGELIGEVGGRAQTAGVFVDPDDALLDQVLSQAPLDIVQLHGSEQPERVRAVRERTGRLVMKALKVREPADLRGVAEYAQAADLLMFDAKPPLRPGALPGGNGEPFDWTLLAGLRVERPWYLSGGLTALDLESAYRSSGARAFDVSSGVERAPGVKDPAKIKAFLEAAARLRSRETMT
ncbi:phosphoribosylanthranilate isomerase [Marinivivus vitaminiproducens]|uniref:phosphoribosylanthranilate isomerase n=1 Tax=Marinivivus vitaminiproducens TaxID=3035935 RepID=UPI00279C2235|nr:phosphoribosylanthranilate isomerase [Geminicoccaceae bacterium SCSIO 64248]